jgi:hypothetical protein
MGGLVGVAALLWGCEIDEVGIPRTEVRIAMHGVLSASAPTQVVLLERTRNGSIGIIGPPFDLGDPVVSDEGIAESGASIRLVTPAGDTLLAREDNTVRDDRKGAGIYRFALPGDSLARGGVYRLLVQTLPGLILRAETTVPQGIPATSAVASVFDRSQDVVTLSWPAAAGARSYFVRIESPFGPFSFFTDSTHVRLAGDLRNADITSLPRVFIPGFPQAVTVSAVDSNYYDWYRTENNPFSGSGLVNRVTGGIGLFGSLVRLRFERFEVEMPQTEPVAGTFLFSGTSAEAASTLLLALELYVESPAARADQWDALSGRYERRPSLGYSGEITNGLLGNYRDGKIQLGLLRGWSGKDTVDVFTGELRGDTIVGSYRFYGGPVHFVRQP